MPSASPVRYWLQPFHGAPLLLTIVTCVLLRLATAAGILGLPLAVLLGSWIWSYAYLLVDYTARGLPPPVLGVEMLNPLHERGPALQALLVIAAASFVWWLESQGWGFLALVTAGAMLALAPASLAVLAVEGSVLRAIWPPALVAVMRGIGLRYPLIVVAAGVAVAVVIATREVIPPLLWNAIAVSALFTLSSLLGGTLYQRRDVLGLEAWESPERHAERRSRLTDRERDREVDQIYVLVRAREHAAALARVSALLGAPPVDPVRCRWLRDRAAQWDDPRIADRLTAELVARLLALGQRGEAILTVEEWWRRGRRFVAHTARDLDLLERAALELRHTDSALRLRRESGPSASNPTAADR
jgi:hypothetical protein